jgi:hypothetical protein
MLVMSGGHHMVLNASQGTVDTACSAPHGQYLFHCLVTACYTLFKRSLIVTLYTQCLHLIAR